LTTQRQPEQLLSPRELQEVLAILAQLYPQPRTALRHRNAFELLIATILSAQTTDQQVNRLTASLFAKYPSPEAFLQLTTEELAAELRSVGLFRSKARHILATCRKLLTDFGGRVPRTRRELLSLPGVGRKTANVILANAFNIPAFAVDTHVFRVANRLGMVAASTVAATEEQLTSRIPRRLWRDAHHWLIYHGRRVCTARNPRCSACALAPYCRHHRQQTAAAGGEG